MRLMYESTLNGQTLGWIFWCPGCRARHHYPTNAPSGPNWTFDGNREVPTFSPSLLNRYHDGRICHLFVTAGKIQYCGDSTHALAGQTVPMVDVDSIRAKEVGDG